jgi:hypothetical protein
MSRRLSSIHEHMPAKTARDWARLYGAKLWLGRLTVTSPAIHALWPNPSMFLMIHPEGQAGHEQGQQDGIWQGQQDRVRENSLGFDWFRPCAGQKSNNRSVGKVGYTDWQDCRYEEEPRSIQGCTETIDICRLYFLPSIYQSYEGRSDLDREVLF